MSRPASAQRAELPPPGRRRRGVGGAERRRAVGSAVAMQVVAGMRVERAMSAIPPPPSASWPWRPHPLRLTGTDSLSCGLHAVQGHSYGTCTAFLLFTRVTAEGVFTEMSYSNVSADTCDTCGAPRGPIYTKKSSCATRATRRFPPSTRGVRSCVACRVDTCRASRVCARVGCEHRRVAHDLHEAIPSWPIRLKLHLGHLARGVGRAPRHLPRPLS